MDDLFTVSATPSAAPDLVDLVEKYYSQAGFSADFARGYIEAQKHDGFLRQHAPEWIRKSATARFSAAVQSVSGDAQKLPPA